MIPRILISSSWMPDAHWTWSTCCAAQGGSQRSFHANVSDLRVVYVLVCNALQGGVIVKAKITSVDNVVGAGLLRKLIERLKVTY